MNPRGTYLVIADTLRKEIAAGDVPDGRFTEAGLSQRFGAARTTVQRALAVLAQEKLVEPEPGVCWWLVGHERPLEKVTKIFAEDGLTAGDPFPSESVLMERTGCERSPVRRALAQLEDQGYLESTHGKGRTVLAVPGL
ncbi:GntR family transcriptional regulator [Streptomyces sp. NPDC101150]|uniref:GntR family transcriptional regulator n=1 Tax=Streptomyces sp. NPDC101150 TaxID=3366114 RepID=UPI00381E9083